MNEFKVRVEGVPSIEEERKSSSLMSRLTTEDTILTNRLKEKFGSAPKEALDDYFLSLARMKVINLFITDDMIPTSFSMDSMYERVKTNLMPCISSHILMLTSFTTISDKTVNLIKNEISNIIYSFVKLEYIRYDMFFRESMNKSYIDAVLDEIIDTITKEA